MVLAVLKNLKRDSSESVVVLYVESEIGRTFFSTLEETLGRGIG
jgi:hypothetical protein